MKNKKGTPFEKLYDHFKNKHGEKCPYTRYLGDNIEFFCQIRFIRNGLEHKNSNLVTIEDFKYEKGKLYSPQVSLDRKD